MMSNQQLIPGMSSQQMQGGQVVKKSQHLEKVFTHFLREEEEVGEVSSSSRQQIQRKVCSGKSQPASPRPPLTRYQTK